MPLPSLSTHPFRIGTTSYVIEADLVANAAYLASKVDDMQLVLFDLPGGPSNLPTPSEIAALNAIAHDADLTYTVHLIADLRLGADLHLEDKSATDHPSLQKAQQVIELTSALDPWAYVLHLDGRHVQAAAAQSNERRRWQEDCITALELVATWAGSPTLLAVENLEGYPPDFVTPVVAEAGVSRCVDIGHLWLDGHDPLPWLAAALPQTRVIHLHGLQRFAQGPTRDHQALHQMTPAEIDPIIGCLLEAAYNGVLTLEVFGERDFSQSLRALQESIGRCAQSILIRPDH